MEVVAFLGEAQLAGCDWSLLGFIFSDSSAFWLRLWYAYVALQDIRVTLLSKNFKSTFRIRSEKVKEWNRSPVIEGFEYQRVGSELCQEGILEALGDKSCMVEERKNS